jgi:hypothetical protein
VLVLGERKGVRIEGEKKGGVKRVDLDLYLDLIRI